MFWSSIEKNPINNFQTVSCCLKIVYRIESLRSNRSVLHVKIFGS
jgi:hypothetical protein